MFGTRDRYQKLHSRRRRRPRSIIAALLATLLVGCAAAAAIIEDDSTAVAAPRLAPDPVVAELTAQDAVANALFIARPQQQEHWVAHLPLAPEKPAAPTRWSPGEPVALAGALKKNESMALALVHRGIPQSSVHRALAALADVVNLRRSKPEDPWEVDVDAEGAITRLRVAASPVDVWEARREDGGFATHRVEIAADDRVEVVAGTIDASLWQAFEAGGADGRLAVAFADIFAYTIDFATETQQGDHFYVAFESTWLDGKRLRTGKIVAARYAGVSAGDHSAFAWDGAYYDERGESVERQFLRSPLATERITSRYGRRFHPVLGEMKMHAGVDYGAPVGTPAQAVADGKIIWAGPKGPNGNLVAIQHAGGYTTYYAHLSRIATGIRPGAHVKKKQVIGRVGSTGRSTGPHLHFGMKHNGAYVNPLEIDFERGTPLGSAAKKKYLTHIGPLRAKLRTTDH